MARAFVFPGQGSQEVGMGRELADAFPAARLVFEEVDDALNMTFLVRQLAPTEHGLPLEIYVFSTDKRWAEYETIQSDIFDHLFASLPIFGLRAFQNPTGYDLQQLSAAGQRQANA